MIIKFLGCGASQGVPSIKGSWGQCNPDQPRNRRDRACLAIEIAGASWLIDVSPDIRSACLQHHVESIGGVLCTHAHFDHIGGLEELRSFGWGKPVPFYADRQTLEAISQRCGYVFGTLSYKPFLEAHEIQGSFDIEGIPVLPFEQDHGTSHTLGFRFPTWAYSTDWIDLDDQALICLRDLDLWIVGCLGRLENPTHLNLDRALTWIEKVKPKKAIITHMGPELDYDALLKILPDHIQPAYDGMIITVP
jgi:phosphoribosyl 1,2-cyclic phosphate phosphodiesterase